MNRRAAHILFGLFLVLLGVAGCLWIVAGDLAAVGEEVEPMILVGDLGFWAIAVLMPLGLLIAFRGLKQRKSTDA